MSVFIRKTTKDGTYSYDFQLGGRRFSGSTGKTTRREAQQVERLKRDEAKAALSADAALYASELSLQSACARYWQEVGQHHANSDTTLWSLGWLQTHFGAGRMLHAIGDSEIAAMVARRRGEFIPNRKEKRLVGPATVNRTVTQPLREVILRARETWKVRTADIDWSRHLLKEPQERVREANPEEEDAIIGQLAEGYDAAVEFAFLTGARRMEILGLAWSRVDFFNRRFTLIGKGGKERSVAMTQRLRDLLWVQQGFHADKVFTYVAQRTVKMNDGRRLVRGQRYPLTESGLKTAMRRAVPRAGVANFRFHDTRHTTATRVLRQSNLRVVQRLLGHADIKTTTKYAHAMDQDVLDALEAASPAKTPTKAGGPHSKTLKSVKKIG